jgi:predicted ATPase
VLRRRAGGRAALVVLEDAHWFDSASWGALARVVARVPRLLVVVTTRPLDALGREAEALVGGATRLVVAPLAADEIAADAASCGPREVHLTTYSRDPR